MFEALSIVEENKLVAGLVGDVGGWAVVVFPGFWVFVGEAFCGALLFAVEVCPADLVAVDVGDSVGVVGVSVVYFCEITVFVGFVADASAAQKGTMCSWHLVFIL